MNANVFPIFLSSLCREVRDLRKQIYFDLGKEQSIYVDEQFKLRNTANQIDLDAVDELLVRVREASAFICVLAGKRHGSPVKIDGKKSAVSFFEMELFQAALLNKHVHILVRNDFDPEPRLAVLLRILRHTFPEWNFRPKLSDVEILREISSIVDEEKRRRSYFTIAPFVHPLRRLVQGLHSERFDKSLFFLDREFEKRPEPPDLELASRMLSDAKAGMHQQKRLTRLWIAIRELMTLKLSAAKDQDVLVLWDEVLSQWARAGAWYGLHGHTPMGCLAAWNSVAHTRKILVNTFRDKLLPNACAYPGGSLASAKYSIATRLIHWQDKRIAFADALNDIELAMKGPEPNVDGLLAVRGSIFRQLGQYAEAVQDYETVLDLRRRQNQSAARIGEALSELGFGYLLRGRVWKARDYCEQGVELMSGIQDVGFLARGLRKLALAYLVTGHPIKAYESRRRLMALVEGQGLYDQLRL